MAIGWGRLDGLGWKVGGSVYQACNGQMFDICDWLSPSQLDKAMVSHPTSALLQESEHGHVAQSDLFLHL